MKRKLIFFDIDGTLTSAKRKGYVYESTKEALRRLQENGHFVALATGRAAFLARPFQERVQIPNMVCEGGNQIVMDYRCISYEYPDQRLMHAIYEAADQAGIGVVLSLEDSIHHVTRNDRFLRRVDDFGGLMEVELRPDIVITKDAKIRRLFLSGPMETIEKHIDAALIEQAGVMHYGNDPFIIVEPADKYKGIRRIVQELGEDEQEVVVFGDGLNDRRMFQDAPFAVAMGNAVEELKLLADYVCADSDHDGIFQACRHFGWI